MIGVVIGKFYPPHRGHKFLIDTAASQVDRLTVIVCDHPDQTIFAETRADWLREIHPNVTVVVTPDNEPDEPGPWARRTIEILGRQPDVVFTSEIYGEGYAKVMSCRHVQLDLARTAVPISATQIRANPFAYWEFLEPCVRAHFVRRVVLIGAESTGKTTLAEELAAALDTTWIPEYGREYCLTKQGDWQTEEFVHIAAEQQRRENEAARHANKILICDTNATATTVWHRRYLNFHAPEVDAIGAQDKVNLYLLTAPDFPFVQDGTRDGAHVRDHMHQWFLELLPKEKVLLLTGDQQTRFKTAMEKVDRFRDL